MFLNINGTVQKRLRNVGGKHYKVANQALYSPKISNEAIYKLEIYRKLKLRLRLTIGGQIVSGYIRHVEIEGERYPMLFCYKNSKQGKPLEHFIAKIEMSNGYYRPHVIYERNAA